MTRGQYITLCAALALSLVAVLMANRAAAQVASMKGGTPITLGKNLFM